MTLSTFYHFFYFLGIPTSGLLLVENLTKSSVKNGGAVHLTTIPSAKKAIMIFWQFVQC